MPPPPLLFSSRSYAELGEEIGRDGPNLRAYIVARVVAAADLPEVRYQRSEGDEGDEIQVTLNAGTSKLVPYKAVRDFVAAGDVRLG